MIALVIGVPGVGKSTVLEKARAYIDVEIVNYGDVFLKVAERLYGIRDRDELREKLTADKYKELHRLASEEITKMAVRPIVLDTHALIALRTGFMPGFPEFVLEKLPISLIIIVEADEEEIKARRSRDATRKRGEGLEKNISLHQQLNRVAAVYYAIKKGASVYIVHNKEGMAEKAGREVSEVLRAWMEGLGWKAGW